MRKLALPFFGALLLVLTACQTGQSNVDSRVITPESSPGDGRAYQYFVLPNQLQVLLISDSATEKAAVSLNVQVGSKDDPADREGLAHFLEHMLFLGTERYPEAGEYQDFLTAQGGSHNAYTSFETTNYFFDVQAQALAPALDRFSGFFTGPLFTAAYVDREKNAVESEYRSKLKDESRRGLDVLKEIANPAHPFSKFTVGSLETLADREGSLVRDELLAFYDKYYSADRMTLVILGTENLVELRKMAELYFADVPLRPTVEESVTEPLFVEGTLPAEVMITPEQNLRRLRLAFPVPGVRNEWQSKPMHMLADVIGHEGEGSLLQALKHQGLAESLSAGLSFEYKGGAMFNIGVSLTEKGFGQRDQVIEAVFQAVARLREEGISRQRFDEQARIADIRFRFKEKSENIHYVTSLAAEMPFFPPAELLSGPYTFSSYSPRLYQKYLGYIRPDNVLVVVVGPGLTTDKVSALYQAHYSIAPVSGDRLAKWQAATINDAIVMPEPNRFIPGDFKRLQAKASPVPVKAVDQQNLQIWHGDDLTFRGPRASIHVAVESPVAYDSVRNAVSMQLLSSMIKDSLNARLYPAYLAGFTVEVFAGRRGLQINLDGYSDKQVLLLEEVVAQVLDESLDAQRFEDIKKEYIRRWENASRQPPYRYLATSLRETLYEPYYDEASKLSVINAISLSDLADWHRDFLTKVQVRAMVYGNIALDDAKALDQVLAPLLSATEAPVSLPGVGVVTLEPGLRYQREAQLEHADSAIAYYVQGAADDDTSRVLMGLSAQMLRSPYYNSLRTEQQFGYVVYASPTIFERWPGLSFVVQSPVADAGTLVAATEAFLTGFTESASALPEAVFLQHRDALDNMINRPYDSLAMAAGDYWNQVMQDYLQFDRRARLTRALNELTLEQWQDFFTGFFSPQPDRGLLVWSEGWQALDEGAMAEFKVIDDVDAFKASQQKQEYR